MNPRWLYKNPASTRVSSCRSSRGIPNLEVASSIGASSGHVVHLVLVSFGSMHVYDFMKSGLYSSDTVVLMVL